MVKNHPGRLGGFLNWIGGYVGAIHKAREIFGALFLCLSAAVPSAYLPTNPLLLLCSLSLSLSCSRALSLVLS